MNGFLVDLEEQSILAAEVLEDGPFGDAKCQRDVSDAGGVISVLGKMLGGRFDDAAAFGLRTRTEFRLALIKGWSDAVACDSRHDRDLKSRQHNADLLIVSTSFLLSNTIVLFDSDCLA